MTKAQALEIFKFMLKSGKGTIDYWNGTIAEQRAAIEMAINALEQSKDETIIYLECNDIAVQEFIKAMKKQPLQAIQPNSTQLIFEMMNREISEDCVSRQAVIDLINADWKYEGLELPVNELPSVTPARKSGLCWIERFDNESMWLECPHCHGDSIAAYNYCPNCGASFKKEKRGNENEIN